jgi:hypothetical protein
MKSDLRPRTDLHSEGFSGELSLIPLWSVVGGLIVFGLMEYLMWVVVPAHRHHPPNLPFWFRFYIDISFGLLAA